jgi:transposase
MGKVSDITPRKSAKVATLLQETSHTQRRIAEILNVSQATVKRINSKLRAGLELEAVRKGRCGRKRITSARDDRRIKKVIEENRRMPAKKLKTVLEEQGVKVSVNTLRRRSYEQGFKCRRPLKKPKLTPAMIKKRLTWAKEHAAFTQDDWNKVVFSDESTFEILADKAQFVRRRSGEKQKPECIIRTVKHPGSIMVWSCISSKGTGRLYIVQGTMKQDQYKTVLQTRLIPQLKEWFPNGERVTFMQDGALCHTAKSIKAFLANENIPLLEWPGNSPDMNPIENVWELVKRKVSTEIITTKQKLTERLIEVWCRDPEVKALTSNCMNSMPRRVKALLKSKGTSTKY